MFVAVEGMRRSWAINGRFLTQSVTGVQRYAREILSALDRHLADGHPLTRDLDIQLLMPSSDAPPLVAIKPRRVGSGAGHAWEQSVLPRHVHGGLISLCNTGPLLARKHIVCIHDANTRAYPASYSLPFRALYRTLLPALGRTASRVATVSQFSADELVRYGIAKPGKVFVAPDGHEHALRWTPRHSEKTRAAAGPGTIVLIGSLAPHKNVGLIMDLADRLDAEGLKVAVAGLADARVFAGDQPGATSSNITWMGRLPDDELAALLQDSLCLAFPSFTEGFGLPAAEAMALGCPVVVTDKASLPEICGDAALYASPHDADAWLACFRRLRDDAALRRQLSARGRERIAQFSWARSAEIYLEEMARVDGAS